MIAIRTYFIGPTNHRGSRIVAQSRPADRANGFPAQRVVLDWDHALNADANHRAAAFKLANQYGWTGQWVAGGCEDGSSVWVNIQGANGADTFEVGQ